MKRQLYLEYLRAIATYAVILWHCVTNVYDQFGPLREWFPASITVGLLVRWSVPVFFMISGALLLNKDEDLAGFYKKRFARICIPLVVWVVLYGTVKLYHFMIYSPPRPSFFRYVIIDNFGLFLFNKLSYHFYFVSIILGLYLLSPFISKMVRSLTRRELEILLLIGVGAYSIRTFYPNLFIVDNIQIGSHLVFFILGHYLYRYPPEKKVRRSMYITGLCSAILAAWLSYYKEYVDKGHQDTFYKTNSFFIFAISIAIFVFFQQNIQPAADDKANSPIRKAILFVSSNSYGFFLAHPLIINILLYSNFKFYTLTTSRLTLKLGGKEAGFEMNNTAGGYLLSLLVFIILLVVFYIIKRVRLTRYVT